MKKNRLDANYYNKVDLAGYENEWVAIADNKVVAHGKKSDKVYTEAQQKKPNSEIGLIKLPKHQTLII